MGSFAVSGVKVTVPTAAAEFTTAPCGIWLVVEVGGGYYVQRSLSPQNPSWTQTVQFGGKYSKGQYTLRAVEADAHANDLFGRIRYAADHGSPNAM